MPRFTGLWYGETTLTPSIASTSANSSVIAACTAGWSTPCSARKTMVPPRLVPEPPKCSSRMSAPRRLSASGTVGVPP